MEKRGRVRWCVSLGGSAIAVSVFACSGQVEGIGPGADDASVDRNVTTKPTPTTSDKPKPPDPPDPPVKDSGVDAKDSSTKDAPYDSGIWVDDGGTCKSQNVVFTPPTIHPPAPSQNLAACSDSVINALADACSKEPESAGCATARAVAGNQKDCADCIFGAKTDANWKMIVLQPGGIPPAQYNQAGCITLASGVPDCGKKYYTVISCFENYCADCVGAQETACQKDTAQGSGECKQYLIDTACGNALDAVEKTCFAGEQTDAAIKTLFVSMAKTFCAKGATGGG